MINSQLSNFIKSLTFCFIASVFVLPLTAQFSDKPKLVVGIVVDQMRQDYLYRYWDDYSEEGFKKIIKGGFQFKNAHYNYVPTFTGPGHASIYTGTTPSRHGIIANNWYDRDQDSEIYCASDSAVVAVGGSGIGGQISARNLMSSTITDELRVFSNFRSKVIGIAIKDRGSALPAGHTPTAAYWYDTYSGDFISSTYYLEDLPKWVNDFNKKDLPQKYAKEKWELLLDMERYEESTTDNTPYERIITDGDSPIFPYEFGDPKTNFNLILSTPYGNKITTDFALAAVNGEELGSDEVTDFLALSYSSTDIAGHAFGPRALEMQDMYLRLDLEIARLLNFLDENVGKDDYLLFLTADHGVADVPAYSLDHSLPGGYYDGKSSGEELMRNINEKYGEGKWFMNVSNNQIFLNSDLIRKKEIDEFDFKNYIAKMILKKEFVSEVILSEDLMRRNLVDPLFFRYQNGFNSQLSGDIIIVMKPGYLPGDYGMQGTTHGSGYNYDTHVPILFYGKNIQNGMSVRNVSITDIAPTISMLLDISLPSAATGQPLIELFK